MQIDYDKIIRERAEHVFDVMAPRVSADDMNRMRAAFKQREDGVTEFVLTQDIPNRYFAMEQNIEKCASRVNLSKIETLVVFGTDDDVVDCREEYLYMYDNISNFKSGHRLNKNAVEEVTNPLVLQMAINSYKNE